MASKWHKAVWEAVQRCGRNGSVTRRELIEFELDRIVLDVGSVGTTPHQTLSRILQELRDSGVIIFDGSGCYKISPGLNKKPLDYAIATEVKRLQNARLGQSRFRSRIISYWNGKCPITGIGEVDLLRASHIVPWNRCETEGDRVDPDNGILLSSLWDAAFDRGLVTFDDEGKLLASDQISNATLACMGGGSEVILRKLNDSHRKNLRWHRNYVWKKSIY